MRDPFDVLGLPSTATWPEIETAYKRLVRELHPDRHIARSPRVQEQMSARMADVTGAFTLLKDDRAYARYRARRQPPSRPESSPTAGPFDYRTAAASEFDVKSREWDYAHRVHPEDVVRPRSYHPPPSPPRPASPTGRHRKRNSPSRLTVITCLIGALTFGALVGIGLAVDPGDSELAQAIDQRVNAFGSGRSSPDVLRIGSCFDKTVAGDDPPGRGRVQAIHVRDCASPHESEMYGEVDLGTLSSTGGYPGAETITSFASPICERYFEDYIDFGQWPRGQLRTGLIYPSTQSWPAGDRRVICEVGLAPGKLLTGSVRTDGAG